VWLIGCGNARNVMKEVQCRGDGCSDRSRGEDFTPVGQTAQLQDERTTKTDGKKDVGRKLTEPNRPQPLIPTCQSHKFGRQEEAADRAKQNQESTNRPLPPGSGLRYRIWIGLDGRIVHASESLERTRSSSSVNAG